MRRNLANEYWEAEPMAIAVPHPSTMIEMAKLLPPFYGMVVMAHIESGDNEAAYHCLKQYGGLSEETGR